MAPAVALSIQGILALLSAAPQAIALFSQAKQWFNELFKAGLITADQQNLLNAHVDQTLAMFRATGTIPPEFQVQPDPNISSIGSIQRGLPPK